MVRVEGYQQQLGVELATGGLDSFKAYQSTIAATLCECLKCFWRGAREL